MDQRSLRHRSGFREAGWSSQVALEVLKKNCFECFFGVVLVYSIGISFFFLRFVLFLLSVFVFFLNVVVF